MLELFDLEVGDRGATHVGHAHAEHQRVDEVPDHDVLAELRLRLRVPRIGVQRMVVHRDHAEEVVVGLGDGLARPVLVDVARLEVLEVPTERRSCVAMTTEASDRAPRRRQVRARAGYHPGLAGSPITATADDPSRPRRRPRLAAALVATRKSRNSSGASRRSPPSSCSPSPSGSSPRRPSASAAMTARRSPAPSARRPPAPRRRAPPPRCRRRRAARRSPTAIHSSVWVGGDSLAGSLGPSFGTIAGATGVVQPYFHSRVSSGLANPAFFNWPTLANKEMARLNPEIVVFIISTNDYWRQLRRR